MGKGKASTGHAQRITRVWLRVLWGGEAGKEGGQPEAFVQT